MYVHSYGKFEVAENNFFLRVAMAISLFDSTVGAYLQIMPSILRCLEKGREHCALKNMDCEEFVKAGLHDDMLPLHFQIITMVHFSEGALNGAKNGVIGGPDMKLELDYDGLRDYLAASLHRLANWTPEEVEGLAGGETRFEYDGVILPFATEDFFCTYATPNFFFHATVAYSILRSRGVPVGIANYIGRVRTTRSSELPEESHQYNGEEYQKFLETLASAGNADAS